MARTKHYKKQTFTFILNGDAVSFYCDTTYTPTGFCHHVYTYGKGKDYEHTRVKYYNRTWEHFEYETALFRAAEKFKKADREAIRIEIDNIGRSKHEKAERLAKAFEANYKALSKEQKQFLADHTPEITNRKQAGAVASSVGMMAALNALKS